MKKTAVVLLVVIFTLALCACGEQGGEGSSSADVLSAEVSSAESAAVSAAGERSKGPVKITAADAEKIADDVLGRVDSLRYMCSPDEIEIEISGDADYYPVTDKRLEGYRTLDDLKHHLNSAFSMRYIEKNWAPYFLEVQPDGHGPYFKEQEGRIYVCPVTHIGLPGYGDGTFGVVWYDGERLEVKYDRLDSGDTCEETDGWWFCTEILSFTKENGTWVLDRCDFLDKTDFSTDVIYD